MSKSIYLLSPSAKKEIISLPMIHFKSLVESIDFSSCDTLMFTSKQGVISAESINPKWKNIPCLAIGTETAKQIEKIGGKILHQASSFYGESLSKIIVEKFYDKNILYLRPKKISFDSKTYLFKYGINMEEKIIYETQCKHYVYTNKPTKNAIIIFTSPSTIKCFFKNFDWDESYTAIVIGETTKKYLLKNMSYVVASRPTIDACIHEAHKILLTSNTK